MPDAEVSAVKKIIHELLWELPPFTNRILNLGVNLTVGEVLAFASALGKIFKR